MDGEPEKKREATVVVVEQIGGEGRSQGGVWLCSTLYIGNSCRRFFTKYGIASSRSLPTIQIRQVYVKYKIATTNHNLN